MTALDILNKVIEPDGEEVTHISLNAALEAITLAYELGADAGLEKANYFVWNGDSLTLLYGTIKLDLL